ncbi:RhoGAP [Echinococcus multilocularis]|uniref:RhoGAP n=1 Tax=Echinococcus multilocularis TaxID=6211 RepID=A0A068YNS9_ECHMU|nr:RhoGAP [Echinococcus multilocularis]
MEVLRSHYEVDNRGDTCLSSFRQVFRSTSCSLGICNPHPPPSESKYEVQMRRELISLEHAAEEEEEEKKGKEEAREEEERGEFSLVEEGEEVRQRKTSIPEPVFTLFAFLARQGIHISDLFRRPGNISQMKVISSSLAKGVVVDWSAYNVYTVANVAKRFLLSVPGGIFGEHNERRLLVAAVPPSTPHSPHQPPSASGATSATTAVPSAQHRLPSKLQHAPGFQTSHVEVTAEGSTGRLGNGRESGGDIFVSSLFSDRTGFLCDFGMLPPSPVEMDQIELFIEILDTLPPPCRELAIIIFGILHSMVRHAGFEVTTGCYSCTPSTPSRTTFPLLRAPQTTPSVTPPPPPPIRTLAEAVSKSVAGALLHTCPLSVDMVDRGAQVMQTLILRFAHLGDSITTYYTDLLLGRVCSNSSSSPASTVIPSMSQVVNSFIVPPSSTARIKKLKGKKTLQKGQGVEEGKCTPPVGRILALASRLLCLTRSRLGGGGEGEQTTQATATVPCLASTTPSPSSVVSALPRPPTPAITTKAVGVTKVPVTAAVAEAPSVEPKDVGEENHDSQKEETDDSEGTEHTQILTRSYIRRSRNRYRAVHRRQMEAMLRRTAWFLGSNVTTVTAVTAATTTIANTAPQLVVTSAGVPYAPTSTQSLLEIGLPLDLEEQQQQFQQLPHSPEGLAVPFYLSSLPRVSVTSIHSAPTYQESPATPRQVDSGEEGEEGEEIRVEGQSRSIPRPK